MQKFHCSEPDDDALSLSAGGSSCLQAGRCGAAVRQGAADMGQLVLPEAAASVAAECALQLSAAGQVSCPPQEAPAAVIMSLGRKMAKRSSRCDESVCLRLCLSRVQPQAARTAGEDFGVNKTKI